MLVRVASQLSEWFAIVSGVRQDCETAPNAFVTGMDWLLETVIGRVTNDFTFGQHTFTALDYADDVSHLAEFIPVLKVFRNKLP